MLPEAKPLIDRVPRPRVRLRRNCHGMLGLEMTPGVASALSDFIASGVRPD